jgi:hypothetical protein
VEWYWEGKIEGLGGKPVPVPVSPPQIPHGLTWARTRASAVRSRPLTACAMARPTNPHTTVLRSFCVFPLWHLLVCFRQINSHLWHQKLIGHSQFKTSWFSWSSLMKYSAEQGFSNFSFGVPPYVN